MKAGNCDGIIVLTMNHRLSPQDDLILQTSSSVADDAYSLGSTFTLQDRVEAIEQSSEEFYQMVSKLSAPCEDEINGSTL